MGRYAKDPDNATKSCKSRGSNLRVHFKVSFIKKLCLLVNLWHAFLFKKNCCVLILYKPHSVLWFLCFFSFELETICDQLVICKQSSLNKFKLIILWFWNGKHNLKINKTTKWNVKIVIPVKSSDSFLIF